MSSALLSLFPPSCVSVFCSATSAEGDARTVFAMHIVAAFLVAYPKRTCFWLCRANSFQAFLFRELVLNHVRGRYDDGKAVPLLGSSAESEEVEQVISRVFLYKVFDIPELLATTRILADEMGNYTDSMMVMDSTLGMFLNVMQSSRAQGHFQLQQHLQVLRSLCRKHNVTCVLLSVAVAAYPSDIVQSQFDSPSLKPPLGPILLYYSDFCALMLKDLKAPDANDADPDHTGSAVAYLLEIVADRWLTSEGHVMPFILVNFQLVI
ncbi:uncharacterized protein V1518DRAFT_412121 [Limtongia smithiae]|uniref:uncharacterized protein n=1 Tax=Limtongia smithiae TaxID=1125753 RepID=UPI0034CECF3C